MFSTSDVRLEYGVCAAAGCSAVFAVVVVPAHPVPHLLPQGPAVGPPVRHGAAVGAQSGRPPGD